MKSTALVIACLTLLGSCTRTPRNMSTSAATRMGTRTLKGEHANAFRIGSALNPDIVSGRDSLRFR